MRDRRALVRLRLVVWSGCVIYLGAFWYFMISWLLG